MARSEGKVEITVVDNLVSNTPVSSAVNYYMGIPGESGDTELTLIDTQKKFIDKYLCRSKINSKDDTVLLHALKLLETTPIYCKRVNNDSIRVGLTTDNEVMFFDENYNLLQKVTELDLSVKDYAFKTDEPKLTIGNFVYDGIDGYSQSIDILYNKLIKDENALSPSIQDDHYQFFTLEKVSEVSPNFMINDSITYKYDAIKLVPESASDELTDNYYFVFDDTTYRLNKSSGGETAHVEPITYDNATAFLLSVIDKIIDKLAATNARVVLSLDHEPSFESNVDSITLDGTDVILSGECVELPEDFSVTVDATYNKSCGARTNYELFAKIINTQVKGSTGAVNNSSITALSLRSNEYYVKSSDDNVILVDLKAPVHKINLLNDGELTNNAVYTDYHVVIDDKCFYFGQQPEGLSDVTTYISLGSSLEGIDFAEFNDLLYKEVVAYFTACKNNELNYIFSGDHTFAVSDNLKFDTTEVEQFTDAPVALVQRFTSKLANASYSITVDKYDSEILTLVSKYKSEVFTDTISFNPDKLDGYNQNIYYEKYNTRVRPFHIVQLNDSPVGNFESVLFGDEVYPRSATVSDYINAIDEIDPSDIRLSFLWDGGMNNVSYLNKLISKADEFQAQVPVSVPEEYITADQITQYTSKITNSIHAVIYLGYQYDTVLTDTSMKCCGGYYYLRLVDSNVATVSNEFVPIFYKSNGRISNNDPVHKFEKKLRTQLLENNINTIVSNISDNFSYFNLNYTNQLKTSDFSEEQNVRIANEISHVADEYLDSVIAKYNTNVLRSEVTSALNNIINNRIISQRGENTIDNFIVTCDNTNNTPEVIENRELVVYIDVAYRKSIITVRVFNRTYKLS